MNFTPAPQGPIPWRLGGDERDSQLALFNQRAEILWFGFEGRYAADGWAEITLPRPAAGQQGGAGMAALNGGVVSAGFDAALVLAGLGHYSTRTVVTLELGVRFLQPALVSRSLVFRAGAIHTTRHVAMMEGVLRDADAPSARPLATATGLVMPR